MRFLPFTLFLFSSYSLVKAGTLNKGDSCNIGDNRLQAGTYQFWSECNSQTYCGSSGKCETRGCRKDDFPFGYAPDDKLPEKCPKGQFCPDEEDQCQQIQPVGSDCQLNRDDQCEGPPNFKELADTSGRGLNVNGSVCLNSKCMWANATLGVACIVENTPYTAYGVDGEFIDIVSRGNCQLGLYCDAAQKVCMAEKLFGEACTADKECSSWNCLGSGVCGVSESIPHHFAIWVYIVVGLGIFGGMFGTLFGLYWTHRKQRDEEREKRMQYWREQNAFHQNLLAMRETARASILSLPGNGNSSARSTLYSRDGAFSDDVSAPILPNAAPKVSGLRHYLADDGSSEFDDGLMMQSGKKVDGRF
ncbi:hypothetical protein Hypma_002678 [Hypsizygus marmoreus]|uniref:Uncharacterized protein n=1 Tax=Hypsizygus marmoreus TaxID=39966 RepID=A0A369J4P6_HYPMA|nr:hypothetical protein Hypma_002678 [Hypsizygus marmoreus]